MWWISALWTTKVLPFLLRLATHFWPIRTGITFFDYWTLSHFFFWFVVGSTFAGVNRPKVIAVSLILAYIWEVFERFGEKKWPGIWLSPEGPLNSYLSDPLMCILGLLIAFYGWDHWRV